MTAETLSQTAYRRIKQDILEGRIAPDSMLSERELALRLGISRTPLRSALSRLENENVIGRLANGALIVRSVTVEQLLEIVMRDRTYGDDLGRRTMISVFELAGDRPELVAAWRRKLSMALN